MSIYSDVNQYDTTDLNMLRDVDAIYQSIDNILLTSKGQRLFLPEFGTNIIEFVFDPMDVGTLFRMKVELIQAIQIWEPRIELNKQASSVVGSPDSHYVTVNLVFNIKDLSQETYVYTRDMAKNSLGQYYAV